MEKKYDFKQVPASWIYCFNSNCPLSGECLRYQSGLEIPDDLPWGNAVFPSSMKDGHCRFYRKDEKVTLATGFIVAHNPRMGDAFVRMRHALTRYLGGNGTYYLYRNGKKWLSPSQQAAIREIFRNAGYQEEVEFGTTKVDYDFT